ncbi:MAG: ATP-binding cassette domain-containing protein, partial [Anaerolineae bacterium]|nr:ATP-binding cassette domain-containing protein [Anaerolineae bacterium]
TTLKMLAGLMYPTGGTARVAGFVPWERKTDYLKSISMVLGNKSQLLWDIPPVDSFRVVGEIYRILPEDYRRNLDELIDLLDMAAIVTKPVRNLSLGERMKCELVAALLYRPKVLFLDEPTLGLDVSMQKRLRQFLAAYNRVSQVTVILTSHYMADVVELCSRVVLIHQGKLIYDGDLQALSRQLAPFKQIRLTLSSMNGYEFPAGVDVLEQEQNQLTLRVSQSESAAVTAHLLNTLPVVDLAVENPPIEAVIDQVYQGALA